MNKLKVLQSLGSKDLLNDGVSKNIFSQVVLKAFENAISEEEERVVGAIALKYDLQCLGEIVDTISLNGYSFPWDKQ